MGNSGEAVKIAKSCKKTVKCDGVNLIQSNESAAGQDIFHFHFHVKPRFKNDGVILTWNKNPVSDKFRFETAEKIIHVLDKNS